MIVEGVGGASLGAAIQRVAPRRDRRHVRQQRPERAHRVPDALRCFGRAPGASLYGLLVFPELAKRRGAAGMLERLLALVAAGRPRPAHRPRGGWRQPAEAIQALLDRRDRRQGVLHVD